MSAADVFSGIYKTQAWVTGSGEGSLPENTVEYRSFLQRLLLEERIGTVLDIGCGDWQSSCLIDWSGVDYVGVDVVPQIIDSNRRLYRRDNLSFVLADATTHPLPSVDLILLKDVLQHWPDRMILDVLPRLLARCRLALLTNDASTQPHRDCLLGQHRPLDLGGPPINLPCTEVLSYPVREHSKGVVTMKSVCLYRRA